MPTPLSRSVHSDAAAVNPAPRQLSSPATIVGVVVFLACLAWMPRVLDRLNPITGDEPFYVMTSISLVDDHDLNEQNNFFENYDYRRFYPQPGDRFNGWSFYPDPIPEPQYPHQAHTKYSGRYYTVHGLGMSFLVAVPFALGGRRLSCLCSP